MRNALILVASFLNVSCQTPSEPLALMLASPSTSLKVADREIEISATDQASRIRISIDKGEKLVFDLPESKDRITRIVASRWCRAGIALAIETETVDGSHRSYFWATLNKGKGIDKGLQTPIVAPILSNTAEDLHLSEITNPGGDTIYVVLMRHGAGTGLPKAVSDGYLYVHRCPVEAKYRADTLYELRPVKADSPK
jgi:hypothetical protein